MATPSNLSATTELVRIGVRAVHQIDYFASWRQCRVGHLGPDDDGKFTYSTGC